MEYETRTYFEENEEESVKGFTIVATTDTGYDIAEKWTQEDGPDKWMLYDIPESELVARVEAGKCEPKATLTQEQYEKVCEMVGHSDLTAESVEA